MLALSLFTSIGAFGFLVLLAFGGFFPLFGAYVDGAAGYILILLLAGAMLFLGRGLYRLRIGAWWGLLALMLIIAISSTVTFWRADLAVLYARMGFDQQTTVAAAQLGGVTLMRWMGPISFIPWLGWLLYVRRYFPKAG